MKKVALIAAAITLSLTACHYGKEEAQESLERNKTYKDNPVTEQAAEIDPEYVKQHGTTETAPAATQETAHDSTAHTEAAPAHN